MNHQELHTTNFPILEFQQNLLTWYKENHRKLPWRESRDPYRIWVSEIMLQQTRVDTVIPYYNNFIEKFPELKDLAEAEPEQVMKAWEGLGYYSRVMNLQTAVKEVRERFDGIVPRTPEGISSLKGVGPYTAGAVLSIAYGVPEPAVDGNVMRVLSRILLIDEDIAKPKTRKTFEKAVRELISHEDPSSFNQALMELGAIICTPRSPACLVCPVQNECRAFAEGRQQELPVKTKKTKVKTVNMSAVIAYDEAGRLIIHKRPETGLLATLWEFPNVEANAVSDTARSNEAQAYIYEQSGAEISIKGKIGYIEHVFSHLKWKIDVWEAEIKKLPDELPEDWRLLSVEDTEKLAFPVSHQKMIKLVKEAILL
ncbi:A/G-specific adenine glycosylase [Fictibacillus iocasae]|uniref:Adenine DNA glycosylase n=1 Tax=Fictibacillus iocasae TaxID=2715437 RepID=A0ABW2NXD8_9BACL